MIKGEVIIDIISQERDKIYISKDKVTKKTNLNEFLNMKKALKLVKLLPSININRELYTIYVPNIESFCGDRIVMEKCSGNNLEILLRNSISHDKGVLFLNEILDFFIKNKFYWKDFAPRNILIDEQNKKINIVDYERGFDENINNFKFYLLGIVYEEYSAFLLPLERKYQIDDIYNLKYYDNVEKIAINTINSTRVKEILKVSGYEEYITLQQYIQVLKVIVENEIPYEEAGKIVFPLVDLEIYIENHSLEEYAKKVLRGKYENNI